MKSANAARALRLFALVATSAILTLPGLAVPPQGHKQTPKTIAPPKARPTLEMVFVIDTTGSMGGLIDGAKRRIWGIVNEVMSSPAHPNVKVGLVAYRDHGDEYITKVQKITSDLDKVYSTLMDYKADGGGDEPEDVRQALSDGVRKAGWSPRSPHTAQIVFLVGDAPPHDDYRQEPSCQATTLAAVQHGLIVNAIECGPDPKTRTIWQDIAKRGEGRFFAIAEDGGVATIETPYDKKLGELGGRVGGTYMAYGAVHARSAFAASNSAMEMKVAAAAPTGAAADRAVNKAINAHAYSNDLLQDISNGEVKLDGVKADDLPDDLRKLSPEARKKEVAKRLDERKGIQAQILTLSKQRDAYIAAAQKKQMSKGKSTGFDTAVAKALREEAAAHGIQL